MDTPKVVDEGLAVESEGRNDSVLSTVDNNEELLIGLNIDLDSSRPEDSKNETCPGLRIDDSDGAEEGSIVRKKDLRNICCICYKSFAQRAGLYNHLKKIHAEQPSGEKHIVKCLEKGCSYICSSKEKLRIHLQETHGLEMKFMTNNFDSIIDFLGWKENYERQEKCRYVKKSGARQKEEGSKMSYYYCNRSGVFISHSKGLKSSKKKGSAKSNNYCTASINCLELPDGKVVSTMCSTHYGHETDIQHLRLTTNEKYEIADQLFLGVPRDVVLDSVRASVGTNVNRIHMITMKDVKNIERAYKIPSSNCGRSKDMFYNLQMWVENMKHSNVFPVLHYEKQGEPIMKEYQLTLIIMTLGQLEVMEGFGRGGIFYINTFDAKKISLHMNLPFHKGFSLHITTLMLVDNLNEAIPVYHMISNKLNKDEITLFFNLLKQKTPDMSAKCLLTDNREDIYEMWCDVYKERPHHLWSNHFVDSDWRQNLMSIADEETQVKIYENLYVYLEPNCDHKIDIELKNYINELQSNPITDNFGDYFSNKYIGSEELWAGCFAKKMVPISAQINMELSSIEIQESVAKKYWDRHFVVRIVQHLVKLVGDKQCARQTIIQRQIKESPTHHKLALNVKPESVCAISPNTWRIESVKDPKNIFSIVTQLKEKCDRTSCELTCTKCETCVHVFQCSCRVYGTDRTMCKHIHSVALKLLMAAQVLLKSENETFKDRSETDLDSSERGQISVEQLLEKDLSSWDSKNKKRRRKDSSSSKILESVDETDLEGDEIILPIIDNILHNKRAPVERKRKRRRKKSPTKYSKPSTKSIKESTEKDLPKTNNNTSNSLSVILPRKINILRKYHKF